MKHTEVLTSQDGITTRLHFDENDGRLIVQNSADIQSVLDENKEFRNDNLGRGKDMRRVAQIPLHVLHQLTTMWDSLGIDRKEGMKKFLNDPDMRFFRTDESKV